MREEASSQKKSNPLVRLFKRTRKPEPEAWKPPWWTPDEEKLWFEFVLRDRRKDHSLLQDPDKPTARTKRPVQTTPKVSYATTLDPLRQLYDMESCLDHRLKNFYIRPRNTGYRPVPVGQLCLNCESLNWGIPLALTELPEVEA